MKKPLKSMLRSRQQVILLGCALAILLVTALFDLRFALGQAVLLLALGAVFLLMEAGFFQGIKKQLDAAGRTLDAESISFLGSALPVAAVRKNGALQWYNGAFRELAGHSPAPGQPLQEILAGVNPGRLQPEELYAGADLSVGERLYRVFASPLREQEASGELLLLVFFDRTDHEALLAEHRNAHPVVAQIIVDNLDEISQNASEGERAMALAAVDRILSGWAAPTGGLLQLVERGRYLFLFEERFLPHYIADKFSVLDEVRASAGDGALAAPTISIGVGRGGETLSEGMELSKQALDMALGRGGDQATVKQGANLEFFGGKSKTVERRTKVKARLMAKQLSDLIDQATNVLVMGHRFADFDSVGSCVGVARLASVKGKPAHIVIHREASPARALVEHVEQLPEYAGVFVTPNQGLDLISSETLLVICDTHNPEIIESKEVYANAASVVVIDHHRRMASAIEDTVLSYHEPYASSTSELVCELAQYVSGGNAIRKREAEAMLAGIVLDTNNFEFKTSFRTFEAAAYLRKMGADTIEVKKLFQVDLESYASRTSLIMGAKIFRKVAAISVWEQEEHGGFQVIAAQAADEMLDIGGVEASFVLYGENGRVHISARSLGTINVQLIMEALGGGGHMTNAGAQLSIPPQEAAERLRAAISSYLDGN